MALVLPPGYRKGEILFNRLNVPSGFEMDVKNSILFIVYLLYVFFVNYASGNFAVRLNILLENTMEHSIRKYINLVEGVEPSKHTMSPDQVRQLADDALNEAVRYIQDHLGVETGDYAGIFFTGQEEDTIIDVLARYIDGELQNKQ